MNKRKKMQSCFYEGSHTLKTKEKKKRKAKDDKSKEKQTKEIDVGPMT
jgi:hypothetical protein